MGAPVGASAGAIIIVTTKAAAAHATPPTATHLSLRFT
jgi:hypothetical protein